MEQISGRQLMEALLVITGVCGVLATIWKGLEAFRQLTGAEKKENARRTLDALSGRLTACEERLERGDRRCESNRDDMTQMLTVLNAMLMHFISGNDHEKLRGVKEGLDRYLAGR